MNVLSGWPPNRTDRNVMENLALILTFIYGLVSRSEEELRGRKLVQNSNRNLWAICSVSLRGIWLLPLLRAEPRRTERPVFVIDAILAMRAEKRGRCHAVWEGWNA